MGEDCIFVACLAVSRRGPCVAPLFSIVVPSVFSLIVTTVFVFELAQFLDELVDPIVSVNERAYRDCDRRCGLCFYDLALVVRLCCFCVFALAVELLRVGLVVVFRGGVDVVCSCCFMCAFIAELMKTSPCTDLYFPLPLPSRGLVGTVLSSSCVVVCLVSAFFS